MYVAIRVAVMSAVAIAYLLVRGTHSFAETFAMALVAVATSHAVVYGIRGLRSGVKALHVVALVAAAAVLVTGGVLLARTAMHAGPLHDVTVGEMLDGDPDREVKLHGYVELGSLVRGPQRMFWLAEKGRRVHVRLAEGVVPPDTLTERAEVLAQGRMEGSDFLATDVVAKCPSTYQTADGPVPAARFRN